MRKLITISLTCVALLWLHDVKAQQQSITEYLEECNRKYGSDASLVNGEKYFYPYAKAEGDPFFLSEPSESVVRVHAKEFPGQLVKYDIYNQQLILHVDDIYGGVTSLVLRNEWVSSFSLDSKLFKRMSGPEGKESYFQVVVEGPISCVYSWRKDYLLNLNSGVQSYYFTEPLKESFLVIGNEFFPYRNKRTFLKAFNSDQQKSIRQYMRQSKLRVKKSPEWQVQQLITYCNSLSHEEF